MNRTIIFAAAVAALTATSVAAQEIPDDLTAAQEAYVDPTIETRGRCMDRPGLPGWMMVRPLGYEWRGDLAYQFRSAQVRREVTEAGVCSCDLLYPDWDVHREEVEAMWNEVSTEKKWDWDEETRQRFYAVRDAMNDDSGPLLQTVVELCEGVE